MTIQTTLLARLRRVSSVTARQSFFSLFIVALLTGCAGIHAQESKSTASALSDANIAAIVVGANKIDISAGELAIERSQNTEIIEFANRMITDHNAVLDAAVELVTRLGVTPVNNDLVATLGAQSTDHEANLRTLSGSEFDKSYIDHEVAYHAAVIGVIENQLIPAAQNQELKDMLIGVVPAFNAHLEHSKMVQEKIQ